MSTKRVKKHSEHYGLHRFLDWLIVILICLAVVCALLFGAMKPLVIKTDEVDLLAKGDIVFADRVGKYLCNYGRGDLVLIKMNDESGKETHIGRLIAFPNERVTISDGNVYVNSASLEENTYAVPFPEDFKTEFYIPQGSFLVLPDDRSAFPISDENFDFHTLLTQQKNIIGEIRLRIYPFKSINLFY